MNIEASMSPQQAVVDAAERLVVRLFSEPQRKLPQEFWELVEALKELRYEAMNEFFNDAS